jgi:hypothetical protein
VTAPDRIAHGQVLSRLPGEQVQTTNDLTVKLDGNSIDTHHLGFREHWKFWVQWAIQRWNERSGVKPRLVWGGDNGFSGFQPGIINVYMVDHTDPGYAGAWAVGTMAPVPIGNGGQVRLFRRRCSQDPCPPNSYVQNDWTAWEQSSNADPNMAKALMHELGHVLGLGHSCTTLLPEPGIPVCSQTTCGVRERQAMAGNFGICGFHKMHGPMDDETRVSREANGQSLPRIQFIENHHYSIQGPDQGWTWYFQGDNFASAAGFSAPSASPAAGRVGYNGAFALAWRGTDVNERLNIIRGFSNNWSPSTKVTLDANGARGSRVGPAIATDGNGYYLAVINTAVNNNQAESDVRRISQVLFDDSGNVSALQEIPFTFSSEGPAATFARVPSGGGSADLWVIAFLAASESAIIVKTATRGTGFTMPGWQGDQWLELHPGSSNPGCLPGQWCMKLGSLGAPAIACSTSLTVDPGRCVIAFASSRQRQDDVTQPGTIKAYSFTLTPGGTVNGLQPLSIYGVGSGGTPFQSFGSVGLAYARTSHYPDPWSPPGRWYLGWSHNDTNCVRTMVMYPGKTVFSYLNSCAFTRSHNNMAPISLMHSGYWDQLQCYHPE